MRIKPSLCPDCSVSPGQIHMSGCDVERCSSCGDQKLSCICMDHDEQFSRWTGYWPGSLEADALEINLNEFYSSGLYKFFFVKPS